jgi:hypothetical protein
VPRFLSPGQKAACVKTSKGMLRVLQELEANHLVESQREINLGSIFLSVLQNVYTIASRGHSEYMTGNRCEEKRNMVTIFFAARKLIVLGDLPKGSKFGSLYFF